MKLQLSGISKRVPLYYNGNKNDSLPSPEPQAPQRRNSSNISAAAVTQVKRGVLRGGVRGLRGRGRGGMRNT